MKMAMLPGIILCIIQSQKKIPRIFFSDLEKHYAKIHMETQRSQIATAILTNESKSGSIISPNFKTHRGSYN